MKPLKFRSFLLAMMLCALCCVPAHALEYSFDAPEDYLFGQPTSSSQAPYPSLHPADEAKDMELLLLFRLQPLRWVAV